MENKNAIKLIEKIQKNLIKDKFDVTEIVDDLKNVRQFSMEDQNPVVTKALRLAYEHLESNNAFLIGIPEDEDFEEETEIKASISDSNDIESFEYFLSLLLDQSKKNNVLDLKAYNTAFQNN